MKILIASSLCLFAGCVGEENLGNTRPTPLGTTRWAVALGGVAEDDANSVAVAENGDVIAGGSFLRTADFGSGPVTVLGDNTMGGFLTRRAAADGAPVWAVTMTGGSCNVMGVAIDGAGNIAVSGYYEGTVDFGGQSLSLPPDEDDMFAAQYDGDGHLRWVHGFGPGALAGAVAVAADTDGCVYAAGSFHGVVDLGNGPVDTGIDTDRNDAFLVAFDSDGARRWGRVFHGDGGQNARSVAVTSEGDVIVSGSLDNAASFGGATIVPESLEEVFAARFTRDGEQTWVRTFGVGGETQTQPGAIAAADDGTIVITDNEDDQAVVHALDPSGHDRWSVSSAAKSTAVQRAVTITSTGDVVAGGFLDSFRADFGEVSFANSTYILAIDPAGRAVDGLSFGGGQPVSDVVDAVAAGPHGTLAAVGDFDSTVDFGAGAVTSAGDKDAFVVLIAGPCDGVAP